MPTTERRPLRPGVRSLLLTMVLAGCAAPPTPPIEIPGEGDVTVVASPPPPSRPPEPTTDSPWPGAVFLSGYFTWDGRAWAWIGGHWEDGRPGFAWTPSRWERRGARWALVRGGWRRSSTQ